MTVLAHVSRVFALLFALLVLFWLAFPFVNLLGGTYGGELMVVGSLFCALACGMIGVALYYCYRYVPSIPRNGLLQGLVWAVVILAGLVGSVLAVGILLLFALPGC